MSSRKFRWRFRDIFFFRSDAPASADLLLYLLFRRWHDRQFQSFLRLAREFSHDVGDHVAYRIRRFGVDFETTRALRAAGRRETSRLSTIK